MLQEYTVLLYSPARSLRYGGQSPSQRPWPRRTLSDPCGPFRSRLCDPRFSPLTGKDGKVARQGRQVSSKYVHIVSTCRCHPYLSRQMRLHSNEKTAISMAPVKAMAALRLEVYAMVAKAVPKTTQETNTRKIKSVFTQSSRLRLAKR